MRQKQEARFLVELKNYISVSHWTTADSCQDLRSHGSLEGALSARGSYYELAYDEQQRQLTRLSRHGRQPYGGLLRFC
jgi:hypothetical protein